MLIHKENYFMHKMKGSLQLFGTCKRRRKKKTRIPLALIPHLSPHYCVTRCPIDLPTFHVLIYQLYSCLLSKSKARVICACPTKQGKVFKSL